MFSRLRKAASSAGSAIKSYVVPTIFTGGRVISSAGGGLWTGKNIYRHSSYYFTNRSYSKLEMPIAICSAAFSMLVNAVTRGAAIFWQFSDKKEQPHTANDRSVEREPIIINGDNLEKIAKDIKLTCNDRMLITLANILGYCSAGMTAISAYLGSATLAETVLSEKENEYLFQSICLMLALSSFTANACYNRPYIVKNVEEYLQAKRNGTFQFTRRHAATLVLSLLSIAAIPFFAFFSTISSIAKLPVVISPLIKNIIAVFFASVATVASFLNQVPALHDYLFTKNDKEENIRQTPYWWSSLRLITLGNGIGDSIAAGFGTYIAYLETMHKWFDIDPHDLYASIAGTPIILSTAFLNYAFSVQVGVKKIDERVRKNQENNSNEENQRYREKRHLLEKEVKSLRNSLTFFSNKNSELSSDLVAKINRSHSVTICDAR